MIPKTLFLYWGGRKLSWLRYLTVISFKKYNPDWKIQVYYPVEPIIGMEWTTSEQKSIYTGEDYFDKLSEVAELLPFNMEQVGRSNDMNEVYKSDIFRLWALAELGGAYSDFDILYTKPLPKLTQRTFCQYLGGHYAIGFLAAPAKDPIFRELLEASRLATGDKYQAYGSTFWGNILRDRKLKGWNIPETFVYSCSWKNSESLFAHVADLPDEAVGVHWYGGSSTSGRWENLITPETYQDHQSTMHSLIGGLVG